jgi:hypothetical protein
MKSRKEFYSLVSDRHVVTHRLVSAVFGHKDNGTSIAYFVSAQIEIQ